MAEGVQYPEFQHCYVYPPDEMEPSHGPEDPPKKNLKLEYIHGWSRKGCRGNIILGVDGKLVYPAAACGVILDTEENTQRFHKGHTDDCVCIDVHPEGKIVATGQLGAEGEANVLVWDSETMEDMSTLVPEGYPAGGIIDIAFSKDGSRIAVIAGNEYETCLYVYNWEEGELETSFTAVKSQVYNIQFIRDSALAIATADGVKHVDLESDEPEVGTIPVSEMGEQQNGYSIVSQGTHFVCGMKNGNIYIFKENELVDIKEDCHSGSVWSVHANETRLVTGGRDGKVGIWNLTEEDEKIPGMECEKHIEMEIPIRAVAIMKGDESSVYVGFMNGDIAKVDIESEEKTLLMQSHYGDGELWGLNMLPKGVEDECPVPPHVFISASDDGNVKMWDKQEHKCIESNRISDDKLRSVCIRKDVDAPHIAVGSEAGNIYILNDKLEVLTSLSPCEDIISVLQFSPGGEYLAVGTHNNSIYVYAVGDGSYEGYATLEGHTSYITHIDWSSDSSCLQSTSGAYELLYWDTESKEQIVESEEMKNVDWATRTCVLGWGVRGMWTPDMDGTDINACCVNYELELLAAMDDLGNVRLLNYPTLTEEAPCEKYIGHCSHVTNGVFTPDNQHLISAGGRDLTLFQWSIVDPE
eukprot:gb/GECH01012409.1/.p1 GENE.gb/GECH01012409.1/~~gb/GECH01012409.1/.p1  ORF type:complete len:639 (+),score=155.43 gb/GECH01012409.1/:1-1917(+)